MGAATRVYTGQGLSPCIYPEVAKTDAVKLGTGTYAAGLVLGQKTGLSAVNEVQTLTFTGSPTGGTFKLTFNGVETGAITFSGTAATLAANVQTALEALSQIGTGGVTVAANSGAPQITFAGALAGREQPPITFSNNALTGGTSPTASVAETTPGQQAGGSWGAYSDGASNGLQIAKAILQYATVVTPDGKHYTAADAPSAAGGGLSALNASAYITGYFRTADLTGIDANGVADLGRIVKGDIGALSNVATVIKLN